MSDLVGNLKQISSLHGSFHTVIGGIGGAVQTLNECIMDVHKNRYTGTVSVTNHGFTCQPWAMQHPHKHGYTNDVYFPGEGVDWASNYCRHVFGPTAEATGRPWCHTVHPHISVGFCDLQICGGKF